MTNLVLDDIRMRLAAHVPIAADLSGRMQAAVAVVLAPVESRGLALLLIRRAEIDGDPWSGQMGLPGGRREHHDHDLLATARRETEEETGIHLPAADLIGTLDDLAPVTPVLPPVAVRPFVFAIDHVPPVRPSPEVADFIWTSIDTLPRTTGDVELEIGTERRTMPAYLVGPHVVWGMTYRILKHFMDLVIT